MMMLGFKRILESFQQRKQLNGNNFKKLSKWISSDISSSSGSSGNTNNKFIKEYRILSQCDVDEFANLTGDLNPIHGNEQPIEKRFIHGSFLNAIVSGLIGTKLPGPGTIVISQSFRFPNKCVIDKEIEFHIELTSDRKLMKVSYECKQLGLIVFKGGAEVIRIKN